MEKSSKTTQERVKNLRKRRRIIGYGSYQSPLKTVKIFPCLKSDFGHDIITTVQNLPHVITILGLGLMLGLEHSLDADHVIAVSTLASRHKSLKTSSKEGTLWGMGHTLMLLLVGILVLGFKLTIPRQLALGMEFCVGAMLVLLGLSVFKKVFSRKIHMHEHAHGGLVHEHPHLHQKDSHDHAHRPLFVGMIHGLAGSSALMLLVLSTISSFGLGIIYIIVFGVGSIISMLVISILLGLPFVLTGSFYQLNRWTRIAAGLASVGLGISTMVKMGLQMRFL